MVAPTPRAPARAPRAHAGARRSLEAGTIVILDRFVDSSLAYQGGGRGLGVGEVRAINLFATGNLQPDRTLLLRISPADGRARLEARTLAASAPAAGVPPDIAIGP